MHLHFGLNRYVHACIKAIRFWNIFCFCFPASYQHDDKSYKNWQSWHWSYVYLLFLCLLLIVMYAYELIVSFDYSCFIFILYFDHVVTFLARCSLLVNLLTDHSSPSCKKHKALHTSSRVATQCYSSFTRYNDAAAIIINNINWSYVYLLCLSSFIHGWDNLCLVLFVSDKRESNISRMCYTIIHRWNWLEL